MGTTVFISSGSLQVVIATVTGGRVGRVAKYSYPLREGSIVNGMLINENEITSAINAAYNANRTAFKDITLIIDSSSVITKKIVVPQLKKRDLAKVVQGEFVYTADSYEDLVYDASIAKEGKGQALFCCAAEKKIIDSYARLFESAGIKLGQVDISLNALVKYIRYSPELADKTFVLNVVDGVNILSVLFEKGVYTFSTRSRLVEERSSSDGAAELYNKLSALEQFHKSQKSPNPIEISYYCGISDDEITRLAEFNPGSPVSISRLKINNSSELSSFIVPIAGCIRERDDIDLLTAQTRQKKNLSANGTGWIKYAAGAVVLAALAGSAAALAVTKANAQSRVDALNRYMSDPSTVENYDQAVADSAMSAALAQKLNLLKVFEAQNLGSVRYTSTENLIIENACAGLITTNGITFNRAQKTLAFTAVTADETEIPRFLNRLKESKLVDNITYSGYAQTTDGYTFSVTCTIYDAAAEAEEGTANE